MSAPVWITATPPTPNGDLHVGHLAGPYVAGDVLRRFLKADGVDVRYTTGLDDHQSYVPVRGLNDGHLGGAEVADRYGDSITRVWKAAGIGFDRVVRPRHEDGYTAFVQEFLHGLYDAGHVVARTRPLPYCAPCERWLYEAYVVGKCPHCGSGSNGNACEPCGRPNDCADLSDPHCTTCGTPAGTRDAERLYFPLAPLADRLTAFWSTVDMPPHLRALCARMLAEGLPEIAVSHPGDWGVPVTVSGFEEQRTYVWFEMAPGYLWQLPAEEGRGRPAPVQFFGYDNGYFHAVLFPALFAAAAPEVALPRTFFVNEFYQLEGLKFSTSRRHAVWAHAALAEAGPDAVRHHVLADRPEGRQTSFSLPALDRTRAHLAQAWDGWLDRLLSTVTQDCDGRVPDEAPTGPAWERLRTRLTRTAAELREAYGVEGFDPRRAVALLDEIVACANDFWYVHAHERDRPGGGASHRAALAAQLAVAGALSAWAAPVMPAGAARLAALLGESPDRPVTAAALAPLPAGRAVTTPAEPVFGN